MAFELTMILVGQDVVLSCLNSQAAKGIVENDPTDTPWLFSESQVESPAAE